MALSKIGKEKLNVYLRYCYQEIVEERGQTFIADKGSLEHIAQFAKVLSEPKNKFGILLYGGCGNGKTTLVKAFQKFLVDGRSLTKYTKGMWIRGAKQVIQLYDDSEAREEMYKADLLAIDDLGTEPTLTLNYGNKRTAIIDLLEERYKRRLFTIITTNLTAKKTIEVINGVEKEITISEIREKYGDRIADRFNEQYVPIKFKNPSFRR